MRDSYEQELLVDILDARAVHSWRRIVQGNSLTKERDPSHVIAWCSRVGTTEADVQYESLRAAIGATRRNVRSTAHSPSGRVEWHAPNPAALIKAGRLPAEKVGRNYVIRESDLQKVANRPTGTPPNKKQIKK